MSSGDRHAASSPTGSGAPSGDELLLASRPVPGGLRQVELAVPDIHCGGCVRRIELALGRLDGVEQARVNLSTKRAAVRWRADRSPPPLMETLRELGFAAHLSEPAETAKDVTLWRLIRALAVAGFASSNVMLLSMSVWSGADPAARDMFHWLSAAVALPAVAYSGRVFFASAWGALKRGRANMDVPISIGVLLTVAMSLYDTVNHGPHAYFDAATSLLFFLLIGRTLDHVMREKARNAVEGLARLAPRGALVVDATGARRYLAVDLIEPGMRLLVAAGERIAVDGHVAHGRSDLDCSVVSGESAPQPAAPGTAVQAGMLNLTGPLTVVATARAKDSFMAEMVRLMEAVEAGRSGYRRIADRAAQVYAPAVHAAAFLSFVGWLAATGDVHRAVTIAVAVLIVTCPCALGLAVPMVQVIAARRLFENGIMVKDGGALERLNAVDSVVFDKTGTLTLGDVRLRDAAAIGPDALAAAAALAAASRHPYARAIETAGRHVRTPLAFREIAERPGLGMEAEAGGAVYRLGRPCWALEGGATPSDDADVILSKDGRPLAAFRFDDRLRSGARETVAALSSAGFDLTILSGDRPEAVRRIAAEVGIARFEGGLTPAGKTERLAALAAEGRKTLMIGDGLNDAPALASAHVSMAPATAADVGRNAADFVFLRESLEAAPAAIAIARRSAVLIRQNFGLAAVYNAIAAPVAIAGLVTPLVAAIAMSLSSIVVVANALRLKNPASVRDDAAGARAGLTARLKAVS
ncbi:heavy metal translocating P-type ATPase [Hansschlegelia zhihuaiae]|uniref:Cadmium-translocating P-type ATPase n=1 Tax=Hansschlegelia zhihuaiae TaxID=405005 RepID=A0A4Q0MC62_9HYPH|nr:heavy metal translocating P-type ATPase [Hansschlegelia zhihuaiae]RXF70911.1 cadmium-translocating P-type ATPase [Hansschlegelia zhihuaiae]